MEKQNMDPAENLTPEQQEETAARPQWQIWGARLALVVFIAMIIMYYINIARGGI